MYRAFGLLPPGSEFALDQALARLTAKFPGYSVTRNGDQITVAMAAINSIVTICDQS